MGTVCLQCGDRGFVNAFVDCVKCLDASVHLYCLDVIPDNFDENVRWECDDCETEANTLNHAVIQSQNRGVDSKNIQDYSKDGKKQKDTLSVQTEERVYNDGDEQSYEGTLLQLVRNKNAKGNWRKKRSVKRSTLEKYEHRLICNIPSKQSYEKPVKTINECTRSMDDSTLPSKMKENEGLSLENHCAETNVQGRHFSPRNDHIENEELNDVEKDFRESELGISSAEPVSMPAWRGSFNIWNDKCDIIDGIMAHMSSKASGKVYEDATQFQVVIDLEILPKSNVWPESSETSQPTSDNIALYFFPSEISERIFDHLVEKMMDKELALKAFFKNAELLIFTSNVLPILHWRVKGKYYLWGVFRCKQNMDHSPKTATPTDLPIATGDAKTKRKRGKRLDDAWEHANPFDGSRVKAECKYCGFISSYGGISRLKAHLGGGHPKIRLPGCDKVSPEVKKVMADWFSEWVKNTKSLWPKGIREANASTSFKRERPVDDDTWGHAVPLDEIGQATRCNYCGYVSKCGGIARLKAHLAGGDPTTQLVSCPNVSWEVKRSLMAQGMKKSTKKLETLPMENSGVSHENQRKTDEILSIEMGHHILRETRDEIAYTSLKDRLQALIQGKIANLHEMQFEIQSLASRLSSMPQQIYGVQKSEPTH